MSANPTEKPASVAAFEGADIPDLWAIPLNGIISLSPAATHEDRPELPTLAINDEVLALDWSFQLIPTEGFHPQLRSSRKVA
jgi:hypothetical protein